MTIRLMKRANLSRCDFLKLAVLGAGALAFRPLAKLALPEFPQADRLGRITVGKMGVFSRPDATSQIVGALYEDNVLPWLREAVGPSLAASTSAG